MVDMFFSFLGLYLTNSQVNVYRTTGPLFLYILTSIHVHVEGENSTETDTNKSNKKNKIRSTSLERSAI